jgi:hypothetical protein
MMKKEDEKSERVGKKWAYGEILHLIALWEKMELEFVKNEKKDEFQLLETLVVW